MPKTMETPNRVVFDRFLLLIAILQLDQHPTLTCDQWCHHRSIFPRIDHDTTRLLNHHRWTRTTLRPIDLEIPLQCHHRIRARRIIVRQVQFRRFDHPVHFRMQSTEMPYLDHLVPMLLHHPLKLEPHCLLEHPVQDCRALYPGPSRRVRVRNNAPRLLRPMRRAAAP
jgi:hypothetical protein